MPRKKKPEAKKAAGKKEVRRPKLLRRKRPEPVAAAPVEARAIARYVRLSPQKARLVVDLIRGKDVGSALHTLRFVRKRAAHEVEKVLRSAIANAEQKSETVDVDRLYVQRAVINEGPRLKRIMPAPYGRAYVFQRRMCHIEIGVGERRLAQSGVAASEATA
ncbi:MAG TPA: 50S ribosomal protein L22 [Candidatus Xenobia bacterium]|nr:50S ribosomal protein L22 [Candidatus Xenobia bacterium]